MVIGAQASGSPDRANFAIGSREENSTILTFDGFNELDSFIAAVILNRMRSQGWQAFITSPQERVTSMNGVTIDRQKDFDFIADADAVIIGSGVKTREIAADDALLQRIRLDPCRQLIGSQCSGTLLLAKLGLVGALPACTDLTTKPWVREAGVDVLDAPFVAHGNVATAGGCLSSQYLAAWIILRLATEADAASALHYVAPVGQKDIYVELALSAVKAGMALGLEHSGPRAGDFGDTTLVSRRADAL
jgi:transcriptional regulator GlxA family with amidase domain